MTDLAERQGLVESSDDDAPGATFVDGHVVLRLALGVAAALDVPVDVYSDAYDAVSTMESAEPLSPASTIVLARLCREAEASLTRAITPEGGPSAGPEGGPIRAQASAPDTREALDSHLLFDVAGDGRVVLKSCDMTLEALRTRLPELARFLEHAATSRRRVVLASWVR
jgi:hypothetical protein